MLSERSAVEKSMEEIRIDLLAEKFISSVVQASSMQGLQESPSTGRRSRPSKTMKEKRSKHHEDLANAKLISSVLLNYIPPLAGTVSHKSISCDFKYMLITAYLPKGIHVVEL
jgi:hypothetical protein